MKTKPPIAGHHQTKDEARPGANHTITAYSIDYAVSSFGEDTTNTLAFDWLMTEATG